ncbi:uncharacterized protein LOC132643973 [Lycium barbarum]|uniref:uncharacterized protein LOC132643973 n=1 Tax=Lycium barbarum TaxID=112863 RepID=UPI00293EB250|nr:uncharacterized protein LOC132643973 [Lycium barbarum]
MTDTAANYAQLYLKEIVRLHGILISIISDIELLGNKLVHEVIEKVNIIVQRLKTAYSRHKSYTNTRHRELEFAVCDKVFLKVSPMKGVMQFESKGKISPCFIRPYEIVRRNGKVAYELNLPSEISILHHVFHIWILRLYKLDPLHILTHEEIKVNEGFSYDEEHVLILDRQVSRLRTNDVDSVKVLWQNDNTKEVTWEAKEDMKKNYPHLLPISAYGSPCEDPIVIVGLLSGFYSWDSP